ncbi:MAG: hypothetical protein K2X87_23615 [Gemmataceae bacterium]|nr:hypothetical protein [Gemmataceae bacterium]
MENPTPGVTAAGADKSPDQIEREMTQTRESITEKVSLLESQVMGNINALTGTVESVKEAVADTVQTVREAVVGAPSAVSDTVKQTLASVGETVKETVGSFSVSDCTRRNPWAAVGTSAGVGFLVGILLPSRGSRPLMARGHDEPVSGGRVGSGHTAYQGFADARPAEPGLFGSLWGMVGKEVRQLAEQALNTALASAKQAVQTKVPQAVDTAVQGLTDRVATAANGLVGGPGSHGTTARVGGPNYTATPPTGGV